MNVHLPSDASFFVFSGFFVVVFALLVVFFIKKGESKVSDPFTLKSNNGGKLSDPFTSMSTENRKRMLDIIKSKYNDDNDFSSATVKLPRVDVISVGAAANLPAVHQGKDPSQLSAVPAVAPLHVAPPLAGGLAPALQPRRRGGRCTDVLESRLLMAGPTHRELRSYHLAVPVAMTRSRGEAPPTEVSIATHARVIKLGSKIILPGSGQVSQTFEVKPGPSFHPSKYSESWRLY